MFQVNSHSEKTPSAIYNSNEAKPVPDLVNIQESLSEALQKQSNLLSEIFDSLERMKSIDNPFSASKAASSDPRPSGIIYTIKRDILWLTDNNSYLSEIVSILKEIV